MKKFLLVAALVFSAFAAQAQIISAHAGYVHGREKGDAPLLSEYGVTGQVISSNGFYIGVDYEREILRFLNAEAGLHFHDFFSGGSNDILSLVRSQISIPLKAKFNYDINADLRGFAFAGPDLQFGLVNKLRYQEAEGEFTEINRYTIDSELLSLRRFNLGFAIGIGFDYDETFRVQACYNFGLLNVNRYTQHSTHLHYLSIGVAYLLY